MNARLQHAARKRLLFVDDNREVTRVLQKIACEGPNPEFEFVGSLPSADTLVTQVARLRAEGRCPDLITLDLAMPGKPAIDALRDALQECPDIKVIIYSGVDNAGRVREALATGAVGYVLKSSDDPWEIVRALRIVAAGDRYVSESVKGAVS